MVSSGTVCKKVVYGRWSGCCFAGGLWVKKRIRMEKNAHIDTPVHQRTVHIESLNFRRPLGVCRGSGSENTSNGLVCPSRGSRDSVRESDWGCIFDGGGRGCLAREGPGTNKSGGGSETSESVDGDGDGERARLTGDARWASQPLCDSGLSERCDEAMRGTDWG